MPARSYIVWPQGGPNAPLITTPSPNLPQGSAGTAYSLQMAAVGGKPPYTWSKVSDSGSGLSLSPSGLLSGTPLNANTFALVITATDTLGVPSTLTNFSLLIISALAISTSSLPNAMVGTPYSTTLTGTGGTPPYAWAITVNTPDTGNWSSINASTGALTGTPGTAETESMTFQLTDSIPNVVSKTLSLTVNSAAQQVSAFKWQPIHGALMPTSWSGAAQYSTLRHPQYVADSTALNSNFGFYELLVHWVEVETSFGVYTTASFAADVQYLTSIGRKLVIKVATYGSFQQPSNTIPGYLYPAGGDSAHYSAALYGPGYYSINVAGTSMARAAFWMPGVQARYQALMQWLAQSATIPGQPYVGLDNNPNILAIIMDEESQPSDVGQAVSGSYGTVSTNPNGTTPYSAQGWLTGFQNMVAPVTSYWKQTLMVTPFNQTPQVTTGTALPNSVAFGTTITRGVSAYGAPDGLPNQTTQIPVPGGSTYAGEEGVANFLGELPGSTSSKGIVTYFYQIEQDDMDGTLGSYTCSQQMTYASGTLGASYIAWPLDTSGSAPTNVKWSTVSAFINANPITNTTIPSAYTQPTYYLIPAASVVLPNGPALTPGQPYTLDYPLGGVGARVNPLPLAAFRFGEDGSNTYSTDPVYSRTQITLTPSSGALVGYQASLLPANSRSALQWTPFASGQNAGSSNTCFGGDTSTPVITIPGGYGSQFYVWEKYYYNFSAMPDNIKTLRGWPTSGFVHPDAYLSYNTTNNVWIATIECISGSPVTAGLNAFSSTDVSFAHTVGAWAIDETFWQENSASGTTDGIYQVARNAQMGYAVAGRWSQRNSTTGDVAYTRWYLDEFTAPGTPITGVPNGSTDKMVYGPIIFDDSFLQTYLSNEGTSYYTTQATHPINSALDKEREIQIQTQRADNAITLAPIRPGAFASLAGVSLISTTGYGTGQYFGQLSATAYDFYISTTGSDSNAGTLAAPWAITSLISNSSNNSKMAGKRVGLIKGTYNVAGVTGVAGATKIGNGSFPTNGSFCALSIPPGTALNPTYVGSSDINGHYSARAAIIFLAAGQNSTSTNTWNNAIIGRDQTSTVGYVTIDGITLNGNNMDCAGAGDGNEGAHIVFFQSTDGSFTQAGSMAGITVCNNEIFGINASDTGGNDALVWLQGCTGAVVMNNSLHDVTKAVQIDHCHIIEAYGCTNSFWVNNTVYNSSGGAFEAKEGCSAITVAGNYFYNCCYTGGGNAAVLQGFDGQQGNPNSPNLPYIVHSNVFDSCGRVTFGETGNQNHSMNLSWYNNTHYNCGEVVLNSIDSAIIGHYNNLYVKSSGSNASQVALTSGFASPLAYDFFYNIAGGSYSSVFNGVTETTGLLTGSDPLFTPGTGSIIPGNGPSQFNLQAGSPAIGSGFTGGTSSGTPVNRGAWDGIVTQIGAFWEAYPV